MRITEIRYLRRVNLGNYEHNELAATAVLSEGDNELACTAQLIEHVNAVLAVPQAAPTTPVEAPKKAEVPVEQAPAPKEEKLPSDQAKKNGRPKRKPTVPMAIPYDRTDPIHKQKMGALLEQFIPGWTQLDGTSEKAQAIRKLSQQMVGKAFIDEKGVLLEDFRAQVEEALRSYLAPVAVDENTDQ